MRMIQFGLLILLCLCLLDRPVYAEYVSCSNDFSPTAGLSTNEITGLPNLPGHPLITPAQCVQEPAMALVMPMTVARFQENQGWPSRSETIPNLAIIRHVITAGTYSWAYGGNTQLADNPDLVAFHNGLTWQPAVAIAGMSKILNLYPAYPISGLRPEAWAQGAGGEVAYFDGYHWSAAYKIDNMPGGMFTTSKGRAWQITTYPSYQAAYYDPSLQRWSSLINLSARLSEIDDIEAVNGTVYVLGYDKDRRAVLLRNTANPSWQVNLLPLPAGGRLELTVIPGLVSVVASSGEQQVKFIYSHDEGQTWQTASMGQYYPVRGAAGVIWALVDVKHMAYFAANTHQPVWQLLALPPEFAGIGVYSNPAGDDATMCFSINDASGRPLTACYSPRQQQWQAVPAINAIASRLSGLRTLSRQRVVAYGLSKAGAPAAFYYDGKNWHPTEIAGLNREILGFSESAAPNTNIWLLGTPELKLQR